MAGSSSTTARTDRDTLAAWDQRSALDGWFDATVGLQRAWLDWVDRTTRLAFPARALVDANHRD